MNTDKNLLLQIKNLSVTYLGREGYVQALKNVNFNVNRGEVFGIVGESASGKSTLAMAVINLLPLDAEKDGEIIFEGTNLFALNETDRLRLRGNKVGLIFQDPVTVFNPVLSIGFQFQETLKAKLKLRSKDACRTVIFEAFKKVHLPEPERIMKSYPHELSGGQLQRVLIAMAISLEPVLLVADEPTSSLDVTTEHQIMQLFEELRKTLGITIIFITHNLDLANILCTRIAVLYKGEVREIKEKNELFNSPKDPYTKSLLEAFRTLEG